MAAKRTPKVETLFSRAEDNARSLWGSYAWANFSPELRAGAVAYNALRLLAIQDLEYVSDARVRELLLETHKQVEALADPQEVEA